MQVDSDLFGKGFAADDSELVFAPFDLLGENMFNCFRLARAEHVSVMPFVGAQGGFCSRQLWVTGKIQLTEEVLNRFL